MAKVSAISFILLGLYINVPFSILAVIFDYPDILREPAGVVLTRFHEGGSSLIFVWFLFVIAAVGLVFVAILQRKTLFDIGDRMRQAISTFGVLAGTFQALGLIRWVFAVPVLAELFTSETSGDAERAAAIVVFKTLHQYAGVAIGEHLGQLFTAFWLIAFSSALVRSERYSSLLGSVGIIIGAMLLIGLMEGFSTVIPFEPGPVAMFTPLAFILLSVWMIVVGIYLLWLQHPSSLYSMRKRFRGLKH